MPQIIDVDRFVDEKKKPSFSKPSVTFNSEGSGYDYETAKQAGITSDVTGHWPSLDPRTGMLLKGIKHPTINLTLQEEKRLGNKIIKKGNRYYSISSTPIIEVDDFKKEDKTEGWWKRKITLAGKTFLDIVAAPWGGAAGLVEERKKQYERAEQFRKEKFPNLPSIYETIDEESARQVQEAFISIHPKTGTEHILSAIIQWITFGAVFRPLAGIFGLGKTGIGLTSKMARAAGAGVVVGVAPKGTPKERITRGALSAVLLGLGTGVGAVAQQKLAQFSRVKLQQSLTKANKVVERIAGQMKKETGYSQAKIFQQMLQELNPRERFIAMNILRAKYGMPQKVYRNWYQKNIGDPLYEKYIGMLEKYIPDRIKDKMLYRYNSPEFLTDLYEQRQINLGRWNELAEQTGNIMTEGVTAAESKLMLRALGEPVQLEILKTARPDLASRIIQARNAIDETSSQLAEQLLRKANITDRKIIQKNILDIRKTILDSIDTYVKRVYERPVGIRGKFFIGRRAVREPKIYERGKVARQIYEDKLNKKIASAEKEFDRLESVKNIKGIGKISQNRMNMRGIKTVDDLTSVSSDDVANILLLEEKSKLDIASRKVLTQITQMDDQLSYIQRLSQQKQITPKTYEYRIGLLNKRKESLLNTLKRKATKNYNNAFAKAEGIKLEAERLASRRRGLISKRNEYQNLLAKPQKPPDMPYDVQKRLNVIETGGYPVARSIRDSGYKIEGARFFNEIADNPLYSSNAPASALRGWKQLPDTDVYGSLRNLWVHPQVEKDINTITRILQEEDKIYNQLLSLWKMGKVTLNPATHGRNIISNTILLEMSGVPSHRIPDLLSASMDDIANNTDLYQRLKRLGLGYGTFTNAEIESLATVYKGQKGLVNQLAKAKTALKPFNSLNRLYQLEEEVFKIAKTRYMMEWGFTPANGLKEGQKWLFNYNAIPELIRQVRRVPLGAPFITFQYKMFPRVIEATFKNPLTVAKYPLLFSALEKYSMQKFNLSNPDVEIIKRNRPLTYILPFTDSEGQLRLYNLQYTLPYGQVFEITDRGVQAFGFGSNPLFSIPYNLFVSNRDPYTGKDIIDRESNIWREFKDSMNFLGNQLFPPLTPYAGYSAKQIGKAIQGIPLTKYGDKPDYILELIGNIAGLKTTPTTITSAQMRMIKYINFLRLDAQKKAGMILKDQSIKEEGRVKRYKEIYTDMINNINRVIEPLRKEEKREVIEVENF